MKMAMWSGYISVNVSENARVIVTAGLAKLVDDENQ
jgi:hypothetical protein